MFHDKVKQAQRDGRLGSCTCWDCLRAIGMTPPFMLRDKYPRRYPHTVFNRTHFDDAHGDPDGDPMPDRKSKEKHSPKERQESSHLKAAVRNREAI
jgi:hypothetical protein